MFKTKKFALFSVMCITLLSFSVFSQETETRTFHLTWDPSPSSDLDYYEVHWGTASGEYTEHSGNIGLVTEWDLVLPVDAKTTFIAVTVYDTAGLESDYSNEVTTKPLPPGGVKRTVEVKVEVVITE